jgi:hypothetical protein
MGSRRQRKVYEYHSFRCDFLLLLAPDLEMPATIKYAL